MLHLKSENAFYGFQRHLWSRSSLSPSLNPCWLSFSILSSHDLVYMCGKRRSEGWDAIFVFTDSASLPIPTSRGAGGDHVMVAAVNISVHRPHLPQLQFRMYKKCITIICKPDYTMFFDSTRTKFFNILLHWIFSFSWHFIFLFKEPNVSRSNTNNKWLNDQWWSWLKINRVHLQGNSSSPSILKFCMV